MGQSVFLTFEASLFHGIALVAFGGRALSINELVAFSNDGALVMQDVRVEGRNMVVTIRHSKANLSIRVGCCTGPLL